MKCDSKKKQSQQEFQYDRYTFSFSEILILIILILGLDGIATFLFYRRMIALIFLLPIFSMLIKPIKEWKKKKRKQELAWQFEDCMQSVASALRAGYSIENAFRESYSDITRLYGNDAYMAKELFWLIQVLRNNGNVEECLKNLGERSGVEDIREFGEIFSVAKRTGGNLTEIIDESVSIMKKKADVDREIHLAFQAKKTEAAIMLVVPCGILLYMNVTSPGFLNVLYGNALGVLIMSVCFGLYVFSFILSIKITNVEV